MESNKQVLVGTIGYHLLGNHSVGPILLPQLKDLAWPEWVAVDELNWGPIAIVQNMEAMKVPYSRVVLLIAVERPDRKTGQITTWQWLGGLPDEQQIQACIGDAATGVISVDNLLVIGEYFKIWPKEVILVDVEPGPERAGEHLTTEIENKVPDILQRVRNVALNGLAGQLNVKNLDGYTLFKDDLATNGGQQQN